MKNKPLYLFILVSILSFSLTFQIVPTSFSRQKLSPIISAKSSVVYEWNRTWGGVGSDYCYGLGVDSVDNIFLSGSTNSYGEGDFDAVLVKFDKFGIKQWNKTWGSPDTESCYGIAVDSQDNIYISGTKHNSSTGVYDLFLVKYNNSGVHQWNKTWITSDREEGNGVATDSSNNVYFTGATNGTIIGDYDLFLMKFNSTGAKQWNETWGGNNDDTGIDVAVDSIENIYVSGVTHSFGAANADILLIKFSDTGILQWNRTWGGNGDEYSHKIMVDSNDNIYLAGITDSFGEGIFDILLIKYDHNGNLQWNRTWGGFNMEYLFGIALDSSDNIYLTGTTSSFGGEKVFLVKYDSTGVLQWDFTWGVNLYLDSYAITIDSADNIYIGGIIEVAGEPFVDMVLIRFSEDIKNDISFGTGYDVIVIIGLIGIIIVIGTRKKIKKN